MVVWRPGLGLGLSTDPPLPALGIVVGHMWTFAHVDVSIMMDVQLTRVVQKTVVGRE